MAKTDYQSVDEYISALPEAVRPVLEQVRGIIRSALPDDAREVISYQIPAFRLPGGVVIWFAGWKEHFSVYPVGAAVTAALGDRLERYRMSKGTIRFPLAEPVPETLIADIARLRAGEVIELANTKAAAKAAKVKTAPAA